MEAIRLAKYNQRDAPHNYGCIMNVVSWISGDQTLTDYPGCVDTPLATHLQAVNDTMCTHTVFEELPIINEDDDEDDGLSYRSYEAICAECGIKLLDWGSRAMGTSAINPEQYYTLGELLRKRFISTLQADPDVMWTAEEFDVADADIHIAVKRLRNVQRLPAQLEASMNEIFATLGRYIGLEWATNLILDTYDEILGHKDESVDLTSAVVLRETVDA